VGVEEAEGVAAEAATENDCARKKINREITKLIINYIEAEEEFRK
jgi:hypothetical protein